MGTWPKRPNIPHKMRRNDEVKQKTGFAQCHLQLWCVIGGSGEAATNGGTFVNSSYFRYQAQFHVYYAGVSASLLGSFFMLFLYPEAHSHNPLFPWLVTPDYLVVSLKWLNTVATLSLVFPGSFPYCQLQSLVSTLHRCYIYPYCLCERSFWGPFVLQSVCCEHTTAETAAIITLYLASLADQITVCSFYVFLCSSEVLGSAVPTEM